MEGSFEETLVRHRRRRRDGIGVVTVLVDAPSPWVASARARAGVTSGEGETFEDAWRAWHGAARDASRAAALARVARASGRSIEEVCAVVANEGAERRALIQRAAASELPPMDRGILEALTLSESAPLASESLEAACGLAALGGELPALHLERPGAARMAWALHAVEVCAALPITVSLCAQDLHALERALPRPLVDRLRAGIVARDESEAAPFRDSAGPYAALLAGVEPAWREARGALGAADSDGARSIAERLLFLALEALPETRGLFALNPRLAGVRFGPRDVEIDLYARSLGLAIEVDGPFHFLGADAYRRDRRKDALLQRSGLLVVRALASDVVEDIGGVLEAVLENVRHRRAQGTQR